LRRCQRRACFKDSRDISFATQTALEDARNACILGFDPADETLENKFHALAVNLRNKAVAHGGSFEIRYRPGYFAARAGGLAPAPASVAFALWNPLDAAGVVITAVPGFTAGSIKLP
jgi:hypothetical protein